MEQLAHRIDVKTDWDQLVLPQKLFNSDKSSVSDDYYSFSSLSKNEII